MKFLSLDSPLMQFLDKAADLMLLSLMTALCSLPVITLGPAVTALYRVLIRRGEGQEGNVVAMYFRAFRENARQAFLAEIALVPMLLAAAASVYVLYTGAEEMTMGLAVLCLVIPGWLVLALPLVFGLIARFENSLGQTLKNAFVMAIGNLPEALAMAVVNLVPVILWAVDRAVFRKSLILWPLLGIGVLGWCTERLLRRIFRRYLPKNEPKEGELADDQ